MSPMISSLPSADGIGGIVHACTARRAGVPACPAASPQPAEGTPGNLQEARYPREAAVRIPEGPAAVLQMTFGQMVTLLVWMRRRLTYLEDTYGVDPASDEPETLWWL
ncbi:uncharacterized protein ACMZJ9_005405 [Mantella aurantiaca]